MTDAAGTSDDLRLELKDQLAWLCSMFGQPSDLPRLLTIKDWQRLRAWVQGVEALAARLIRLLAAAMPAPATPPPGPARTLRFARTGPDTDHPDSARWIGVRFRWRDDASSASTLSAPTAADATQAAVLPEQSEPRDFRSARHLALRLEAVIRVAENAGRYARRYCGRLARRQTRPVSRPARRIEAPSAPRVARIAPPGPPIGPPPIESG